MKRCKLFFLFIASMAISTNFSQSATGQQPSTANQPSSHETQQEPKQDYAYAEDIDQIIQSAFTKQQLVGLGVVLIDDSRVVWSKGYGWADRENQTPVDPDKTQFRWASISKPVTAVAAMQLAEAGRLDLDADIRQYVPEFPDKGTTITSRQLLSHLGGIVHYSNGPVIRSQVEYSDPHPFADVVYALDKFKESPLVNQPGEKYSYTTHGFILLSAVVQRAGDQSFADQVHQRIAKPLGMNSFQPDYAWKPIENRTIGYFRNNRGIRARNEPATDVSWKLGGGGFTSTTEDLAKFGLGMLQDKLVSPETKEEMWTLNPPSNPKGSQPYGLGFAIYKRPSGEVWFGHNGSQEKTRTCLLMDPEHNRVIALMCNSEWAGVTKIGMEVLDKLDQTDK